MDFVVVLDSGVRDHDLGIRGGYYYRGDFFLESFSGQS